MSMDDINLSMEPPSLRRTQSLASVSSVNMPIDCDYTEYEPMDIIAHGMAIIKVIIDSAKAKQQSKLEKSTRRIRRIFKELDRRESARQQETEEQKRRMDNLENALIKHEYAEQALKNDLDQCKQLLYSKLKNLPTTKQIKEIIQDSTQELLNIKDGNLSLPPPVIAQQQSTAGVRVGVAARRHQGSIGSTSEP